jgi:5-(carboxyamino)imidazole ribonucleotide mutase
VAINGSANAALLAVQMLAMSDPELRQALQDYRRKMARSVLDKNEKLQQLGVKGYLER